MVDWVSIPIAKQIISGLSYLKKYFDLNARENQLKNWELELTRLRNISKENSKIFLSMIDFDPYDTNGSYIHAGDNVPSPNLELQCSITNRSLFDLKIKKIYMRIQLENVGEIGEINAFNEIDLPHQQIVTERLKLQLHPNSINILKSLKKDGKKNLLRFTLLDVYIDFEGERKFRKPWTYNFSLELPMDKVYIG